MPINKLVLNISGPLMISMLVQALYNIVDSMYVAQIEGIGDAGINPISIAFPIQLLGIAVAVGVEL